MLFPLSNLYKDEVRKIAKDIDLSVSNKKDSVGICFIGERNLKDFLGRFIDLEKENSDDLEIILELIMVPLCSQRTKTRP